MEVRSVIGTGVDAVTGEIVSTQAVQVYGTKEALVVGPDEVLIVNVERALTGEELNLLRDRMLDALGHERFLIVAGDGVSLAKVQAPGPYRDPYRPTANEDLAAWDHLYEVPGEGS